MGSFDLCVSNAKRVCQSLHKRANSRTLHCTTMVFVQFLYLDHKDSFDLEFTFCPSYNQFLRKQYCFCGFCPFSLGFRLLLLMALTKQNSFNISQCSKTYESAKYAYKPIFFFCLPCLLCRIY